MINKQISRRRACFNYKSSTFFFLIKAPRRRHAPKNKAHCWGNNLVDGSGKDASRPPDAKQETAEGFKTSRQLLPGSPLSLKKKKKLIIHLMNFAPNSRRCKEIGALLRVNRAPQVTRGGLILIPAVRQRSKGQKKPRSKANLESFFADIISLSNGATFL